MKKSSRKKNGAKRLNLSAAALAKLDPETRARREVLAKLRKMTAAEFVESLVHAGIYTKSGRLRRAYRDDVNPGAYRPND